MNECKMKKIWSLLFVFGFMIVMSSSAFAIPLVPHVDQANIDIIDPVTGEVIRTDSYADILNSLVQIEGDVSSFAYGSGIVLTDSDPNDYYKVDFNLAVDPDPWYVWNVNIFNSSTKYIRCHTETFSGTFTEPVGANTDVSSEIGGLIQDFSRNGVRVAPVNQSNIAITELYSPNHPSVNLGVDVGDAFELDGSGAIVEGNPNDIVVYPPPFTGMYGYFNSASGQGPDPYPDSLWTGFRTTVSFSVTPWDSANFNGKVNIEPTSAPASHTPEPSTLFLIGAGLVMVGLVAWRRKRQS
jgi:hypothetical protein